MEKADVSNRSINFFFYVTSMPTIPPLKLKKKKNQIKTKTREIPPTTHIHLLSLKSIILAHTTSIKNQDIFLLKKKKQDIPCPKIIHCYLGLSSEERRQPFSGPLYINTPSRKTSPYKPLRT